MLHLLIIGTIGGELFIQIRSLHSFNMCTYRFYKFLKKCEKPKYKN